MPVSKARHYSILSVKAEHPNVCSQRYNFRELDAGVTLARVAPESKPYLQAFDDEREVGRVFLEYQQNKILLKKSDACDVNDEYAGYSPGLPVLLDGAYFGSSQCWINVAYEACNDALIALCYAPVETPFWSLLTTLIPHTKQWYLPVPLTSRRLRVSHLLNIF
ncbi:hypothetical protein MNBD_GAMMA10-993 [hydrothermal vent metagenome]|uniref:Uncharacterized protein n=1 Tax=hydrothermal vent metagenome TaxID=652676 RepID=A0A3B0XPZ2_9ZZZZ